MAARGIPALATECEGEERCRCEQNWGNQKDGDSFRNHLPQTMIKTPQQQQQRQHQRQQQRWRQCQRADEGLPMWAQLGHVQQKPTKPNQHNQHNQHNRNNKQQNTQHNQHNQHNNQHNNQQYQQPNWLSLKSGFDSNFPSEKINWNFEQTVNDGEPSQLEPAIPSREQASQRTQ